MASLLSWKRLGSDQHGWPGRALDNIFIERLWRTVKYEDIYLMDYTSVPELEAGLDGYFQFYNRDRLHQSLGYRTPAEVHYALSAGGGKVENFADRVSHISTASTTTAVSLCLSP